MSEDYRSIMKEGLWENNVVFSQMLALCFIAFAFMP